MWKYDAQKYIITFSVESMSTICQQHRATVARIVLPRSFVNQLISTSVTGLGSALVDLVYERNTFLFDAKVIIIQRFRLNNYPVTIPDKDHKHMQTSSYSCMVIKLRITVQSSIPTESIVKKKYLCSKRNSEQQALIENKHTWIQYICQFRIQPPHCVYKRPYKNGTLYMKGTQVYGSL